MKKMIMLFLMGMLPFLAINAEESKDKDTKPVTIENFEKQVSLCNELMGQNKKISTSTKRSFNSYIRNIKLYLGQKRYRNVADNYSNLYNYNYPDEIRKEVDKVVKISELLVKQSKAKMLKAANAVYQEVIKISEKDVTQDDIDNLTDSVEIMRDKVGNISGSNPSFKRIYKNLQKASRFLQYWGPFTVAKEDGDYNKAISQLDSLISNYSSYSVLPTKVLRAKKSALMEESVSKFDAEIAVLRKALMDAEGSEETKKVINRFQVLYNRYASTLRNNTRYNELSYSKTALDYWLNVVAYEESEDFRQAISSLNNFNSGYYRNTFLLKWKDIQAKKHELAKKMISQPEAADPVIISIDEFMKNCQDLKSLISFGSKLQELKNNYSGRRSQELYALQTDLQTLANIEKAFKSGNFTQVFQLIQYQQSQVHRWQDLLNKYKEMLRLEAVAAVADVDVKKLQNKEKKPGNIILEFADKAAKNKEWGNVYLLLNAYAMAFCSSGVHPVWLKEEIMGCKSFMTGKNFEKAGMFNKAIFNYIIVLQQKESKRIPLEDTIERINAIRENNPNLFDPKTGELITHPHPQFQPRPVPVEGTPVYYEEGIDKTDITPKR